MHALQKLSEHSIARRGDIWTPTGLYSLEYWSNSAAHSIEIYRKGLNARQAEYAVKKYRSHRKVGAGIMMDVNIMNSPW